MTFPNRIFLVGLPGAGKSTVGQYLAKELTYSFCDLDQIIEKNDGRLITRIFSEDGEASFRLKEKDALRSISQEKVVVATGGGAPCFHENMKWMNDNGFTVFLNPSIETIVERIIEETHRPLMQGDPKKKLLELLSSREVYYKQSGMESSQSDPCEILAELLHFFKN